MTVKRINTVEISDEVRQRGMKVFEMLGKLDAGEITEAEFRQIMKDMGETNEVIIDNLLLLGTEEGGYKADEDGS